MLSQNSSYLKECTREVLYLIGNNNVNNVANELQISLDYLLSWLNNENEETKIELTDNLVSSPFDI